MRFLLAGFAGALGLALIGLGVPPFVAQLNLIEVDVRAIAEMPPGPERAAAVDEALRAVRAAAAWHPTAETSADIATLTALGAFAQGRSLAARDRDQYLAEVIAVLSDSLARRPVSAWNWMRLADARFLKDGPSTAVADAVRLSIVSDPFWSRGLSRLRRALSVRAFWDEQLDGLVERQFVIAWKRRAKDVRALAAETGTLPLLAAALAAAEIPVPESLFQSR